MTTLQKKGKTTSHLTSKDEMELARVAQRCIVEALDRSRAVSIKLDCDHGDVPSIELPPASLRLIGQLLGLMSEGKPFTLMPEKQELSTVEAANFLNVSRPFVIKEIDSGRLKHRMVGKHRRVLFTDLRDYANNMQQRRKDALDKLSDLSKELGGY